ncbi:hypothetical protein QR680_007057 [Steinernema hermaphroditum]|nr:hypothetical protein QR680_007057 [Steinernema hermaphroditum]
MNNSTQKLTAVAFRLECSDGAVVPISAEAVKQSITLRTMIDDIGMKNGDVVIPLANVDGATAKLIVEWCEKHKTDAYPTTELNKPGPNPSPAVFEMSSWDSDFLSMENVSIPEMAKLVTAADFLNVPWLYKYCCRRIYEDYIQDRSVAELKELLEP